ncbi:mechanosensitive ion channel [Aquimarina sp. MMG015]|uniref:mechanosensitive ion channel domain-containing protein n=1 Tax=unclassified Aquimarina TaxID=2627091 RepID=UPI000E534C31|nr:MULTISPECIES: mechanosensitive ion channel domain-containing protein [unclassified Aquimarina]AXT58128.1 mechanosensitive ion channel protein MscS [Aquimarina sp. AD1]MBQ4802983.1 mechanosensitive ion channel [Aquimarina sp. MMG015]RKN06903.1 mechanosensitive ion channel protein MscS [Aquimarina sp. AD1]
MLKYQTEIFLTIVLVIIMIILLLLSKKAIQRFGFIRSIEANRRKIIFKLSHLLIYVIAISILAIIWGVDRKQFAVFISSVMAVLGVGFFAQWSLLSSLTASVILFFNHPVRIGDRIRILDKDFDWTGEIIDITGFYLFMKTDDGRNITIPNSLVMQKGIEILEKK